MLRNVKDSFDHGIEKLRWFSEMLNERLRVELAVTKLLASSNEMKKKRDELAKSLGERIFELRAQHDPGILKDGRIRETLKEMEDLDKEMEDLRSKASDIGKADI